MGQTLSQYHCCAGGRDEAGKNSPGTASGDSNEGPSTETLNTERSRLLPGGIGGDEREISQSLSATYGAEYMVSTSAEERQRYQIEQENLNRLIRKTEDKMITITPAGNNACSPAPVLSEHWKESENFLENLKPEELLLQQQQQLCFVDPSSSPSDDAKEHAQKVMQRINQAVDMPDKTEEMQKIVEELKNAAKNIALKNVGPLVISMTFTLPDSDSDDH